jgi:hypothetical protein
MSRISRRTGADPRPPAARSAVRSLRPVPAHGPAGFRSWSPPAMMRNSLRRFMAHASSLLARTSGRSSPQLTVSSRSGEMPNPPGSPGPPRHDAGPAPGCTRWSRARRHGPRSADAPRVRPHHRHLAHEPLLRVGPDCRPVVVEMDPLLQDLPGRRRLGPDGLLTRPRPPPPDAPPPPAPPPGASAADAGLDLLGRRPLRLRFRNSPSVEPSASAAIATATVRRCIIASPPSLDC